MGAFSADRQFVVERSSKPRHDYWLLLSAFILAAAGLLCMHSIDRSLGTNHAIKQSIFFALGLGVFLVANKIKLTVWKNMFWPLYIATNVLLFLTLLIGKGPNDVKRWIAIGSFQFQSSEVAKILIAVCFGVFYAKREEIIRQPKVFAGALLVALPPLLLIFKQPHLGGALSIIVMTIAAALYAGVPGKFFPIVLAGLILLGGAVWVMPNVLSPYMRGRVNSLINKFVNDDADVRGSGYQQHQAMIAIGSGGPLGAGLFNGDQKAADIIPEQHSDFIFSVVGEEGGFFGSVLLLICFGFFFFRAWLVGYRAKTTMGRVVAGSLFAVLGFHFIVNMAMVLQIGPVVGLWLPFMSYGGTALWMCMASVGILDQCE
ncbi:MAG: rod shape-determining protein RodA [Armatimonadetes bacterium]|nr:rod shape-determining protein RodA [Armatimonadota bacterium]